MTATLEGLSGVIRGNKGELKVLCRAKCRYLTLVVDAVRQKTFM
jgi:hypothetical protein